MTSYNNKISINLKTTTKDDTTMRKANFDSKSNKNQSLEKTMKPDHVNKDVKTYPLTTIACVSQCEVEDTDTSNLGSASSKNLVTPYAEDRDYYFENDHLFQKLIEHSDNKIVSRMAIMLYADCVAWNIDCNKYMDSSYDCGNKVMFGKELIKFGYGIVSRRDLFYPMFVKTDRAEVSITRCYDDIESYTSENIEDEIYSLQHLVDDTVSVIVAYGYKYPEVIFAMEVVNSYVM